MRTLTPFWLLVVFSLTACAQTPLAEETPQIRMPLGFGYAVFDIPCTEIKKSIPTKLEELEIEFEWTDEEEGLLTVGPITEETESNDLYSKIRQTYFLEVVCDDELSTGITGEAALEGLNTDEEWIAITDAPTIDQYAMQFLDSLDM